MATDAAATRTPPGGAADQVATPGSLRRAHRLLWLAVVFFVLAFGVGTSWDRAWHATHPFEDFWSPPHRFIYAMHGLAALTVARLVSWPAGHQWFGPAIGVPLLPLRLPGSLVLLGGGLATVSTAGAFDAVWHTRFGLDETGWSFPHAMLGWGILLTLYGFVSCRLALASRLPPAWYTRLLIGVVLLGATMGVLLGPFGGNTTPDMVRSVAALPVLADEPAFQHTARIYLAANVTRLNPLFVPLAAFAACAGLALVRSLLPGRRWVLAVALLSTGFSLNGGLRTARFFGLQADPQTWLPLPVLPAAAVLWGAQAAGLRDRWIWAAAGAAFGVFAVRFWAQPPLLIVPATVLFAGGAALGQVIARALATPTARRTRALLFGLGLAVPAALGVLDLTLRARIP